MAKSSRSRGGEPGRKPRAEPAAPGRPRPSSPRARLFLALEPAAADREALARWRDEAVAGRDDLRPVAPHALHLTLVFLGYRPEKDIERIAAVALEPLAEAAAVTLEPLAVKGVPPRAPRLFALDLADPDGRAAATQSAASEALAGANFYTPEKRPWWPHVTLARVKRHARAAPLAASAPSAAIVADRVTLYRSLLRPQGAIYDPLASLDLSPPGG